MSPQGVFQQLSELILQYGVTHRQNWSWTVIKLQLIMEMQGLIRILTAHHEIAGYGLSRGFWDPMRARVRR